MAESPLDVSQQKENRPGDFRSPHSGNVYRPQTNQKTERTSQSVTEHDRALPMKEEQNYNRTMTTDEKNSAVDYGSMLLAMKREAKRHQERQRSVEEVLRLVKQMEASLTTAESADEKEVQAQEAVRSVRRQRTTVGAICPLFSPFLDCFFFYQTTLLFSFFLSFYFFLFFVVFFNSEETERRHSFSPSVSSHFAN